MYNSPPFIKMLTRVIVSPLQERGKENIMQGWGGGRQSNSVPDAVI